MTIEFGLIDELANTQYAPLAALSVHYQQNLILKPLAGIQIPVKTRDFSPSDKLVQALFSVLAGCELFTLDILHLGRLEVVSDPQVGLVGLHIYGRGLFLAGVTFTAYAWHVRWIGDH